MLGSGLGRFADELTDAVRIAYRKIPNFPRSTAVGHAGRLVIGKVDGLAVAAMQGRVHLYEGYSAREVAFAMRVFGRLGIRSAILTNAAGGINLDFTQGALVVIRDHINLQGANPLVGLNDDRFGPRFPDMTQAYWSSYREIALAEAKKLGIAAHQGVYAALLGPSYETPAEIRYLRTIGADLVGMSTAAGSDCGAAHGNSRARNFLRDEYGFRDSGSSAGSCGSSGNRRTCERSICRAAASGPAANRRRKIKSALGSARHTKGKA